MKNARHKQGARTWTCLGWLACWPMWGLAQVALPEDPQGPYVDLRFEAWSNGLPVLDIDGDWTRGYTRRDGSQRGYIQARAEAGASFRLPGVQAPGGWRVGALARMDGTVKASGDAAQVLYHYQSRTDPSGAASYDAGTLVRYWAGRGVAIHTAALQVGGWRLSGTLDLMRLQRLRSVQTAGSVSYDGVNDYAWHGTLRDDDARNTQLFIQPPAASGRGQSVSMVANWAANPADGVMPLWQPHEFSVQVDDVWSKLSWDGVNGNDAVLDSQTNTRTPEGYIEYRAAIQGRYTRRRLVERVPVASQMQMRWRREAGAWRLQVKHRLGLWQYWAGWESEGAVRWHVDVEPVAQALAVGFSWQGLSVNVMGDRVDRAAHARGGQISWLLPF